MKVGEGREVSGLLRQSLRALLDGLPQYGQFIFSTIEEW